MKIILFLFSFFFALASDACSCRGISDYYTFFKNADNLFVGQLIEISDDGDLFKYEFSITDKLRGDFKNSEFVYSAKTNICPLQLKKGEIYLVEVSKIKGRFYTGYCHFNESAISKTFKEDTILIKLFSKSDFVVNSTYFRGSVKNGKRVGRWTFFHKNDTTKISETGLYKNDKRDSVWTAQGNETFYENGQFVKSISFINEDDRKIKREVLRHESILYYPNGNIYKRKTRHRYYAFYQNGILSESSYINRQGFFYKSLDKYDQSGKLIESRKLKNNNEIPADNYCCFD